MKKFMFLCAGFLIFGIASVSQAAPLLPVSYDMLNGQTGSFWYFDDTYSGSGNLTTPLDPLSGGLGDLTDGVIATDNWFNEEPPPGTPVGPYVGWVTIDPTIDFHFGQQVTIDTVTFYVDDANGNGGVRTPASFTIGSKTYAVADPVGSAPLAFTFDNLGLSGSDLSVTINRQPNSWVFVSEIQFGGTPIPEPATMLLLGTGLLGIAGFRRQKFLK